MLDSTDRLQECPNESSDDDESMPQDVSESDERNDHGIPPQSSINMLLHSSLTNGEARSTSKLSSSTQNNNLDIRNNNKDKHIEFVCSEEDEFHLQMENVSDENEELQQSIMPQQSIDDAGSLLNLATAGLPIHSIDATHYMTAGAHERYSNP